MNGLAGAIGGTEATGVAEIDLNSDVAEGFGAWRMADDQALLDIVTSANIACGFHAGDPQIMRRVCVAAVLRGVSIGAQVGYRDLAGFGRRFIDVDPAAQVDDVLYQLGALDGIARVAGGRVAYVKPHGALYNAIVTHDEQAAAVVEAVRLYNRSLLALGLPGSRWLALAREAGLGAVEEGFADRAYTPEGALVPRREPGAVLHDPDEVSRRAVRMVNPGEVVAIDGTLIPMRVRSLCVHGDTPGSVGLARAVRAALTDAGIPIRSFV